MPRNRYTDAASVCSPTNTSGSPHCQRNSVVFVRKMLLPSSWDCAHSDPNPIVMTIPIQAIPLDHLILHDRAFLHFKRIAWMVYRTGILSGLRLCCEESGKEEVWTCSRSLGSRGVLLVFVCLCWGLDNTVMPQCDFSEPEASGPKGRDGHGHPPEPIEVVGGIFALR